MVLLLYKKQPRATLFIDQVLTKGFLARNSRILREESLVFCLPGCNLLPLLKVLLCGSKEEISLGFMKMNGGFSRYYVFAFKAAARDWSHTVFMERSRQRSERNKGRVENFSGKFDSHSLAALLQRAMSQSTEVLYTSPYAVKVRIFLWV